MNGEKLKLRNEDTFFCDLERNEKTKWSNWFNGNITYKSIGINVISAR